MKMERIAILLTVYNRREKTLACLANIYRQKSIDNYLIDIYLTDDNSTDGTAEAVKEQFPQVNIINGSGTLYWNRGMIAAWSEAVRKNDYDFYLWLNDDAVLIDEALRLLLNCSKEKDDKAIIVGATYGENSGVVTYSGYEKNGKRILPDGTLQRCEYFNGNIVLIPKAVYHAVGMNDNRYSHSIGDFDYGLRANQKGIEAFVSSCVLGFCDRHNNIPIWCNPNYNFKKRWKSFISPLGAAPLEYFLFDRQHKGLIKAYIGLIGSYIRCLFPQLFFKRMKNNNMYFNN